MDRKLNTIPTVNVLKESFERLFEMLNDCFLVISRNIFLKAFCKDFSFILYHTETKIAKTLYYLDMSYNFYYYFSAFFVIFLSQIILLWLRYFDHTS